MNIVNIPHPQPRKSTARILRIAGILLLFAANGVSSGSGRSPAIRRLLFERDDPLSALQINKPVERTLASGQADKLTIPLAAGEFTKLEVDHPGIRLSVSIVQPDGKPVLRYIDERQPRLFVSAIGLLTGDYTVVVSSLETGAKGLYRISVLELRRSRSLDAEDIEGELDFQEAERLSGDYTFESYKAAISDYKNAALHWTNARDLRREASALMGLGDVFTRLSDRRAANNYFFRALGMYQNVEDKSGVAAAQNRLAYNYIGSNDLNRSLDLSKAALLLSREAGDREQEAWALFNTAYADEMRGDKKSGIKYYQDALDAFSATADRRGQALALTFMGVVRFDMSDIPTALECLQKRALPLWESTGDKWGEALAENKLALVLESLGERQAALEYDRKAFQAFHSMGDREHEGVCLNSMGYLLLKMGQLDEAYQAYNQSLPIFESTGDIDAKRVAIARIGKVHELKGERGLALHYYRKYLALTAGSGSSNAKAYILQWIGDVYAHTDLATAMKFYSRALRIRRSVNEPRGLAQTLNCVGFVLYLRKEYQGALDYFRQAQSLQQSVKDREGESSTLYSMALAERDSGNLTNARNDIERSLSINEALRAEMVSQAFRASYSASVHQRYELHTDVLMRLYSQNHSPGLLAAAVESSEHGRARSMLEMLVEAQTDIKQGVPPSLLEAETSLLDELRLKEQRRIQLLSQSLAARTSDPSGSKTLKDRAEEVDRGIDSLDNQYDDLQERIRLASPAYAALKYPRTPSLSQLQHDLDRDTVLLEFQLGEDRSYLWAVTNNDVKGYELPPRAAIERLSQRTYLLLSGPTPDIENDCLFWAAAKRLSATVLAPAKSLLTKERIIVVADGALQYIPFGVLPDPNQSVTLADSPVPLLVQHEVAYLPSAGILSEIRREVASRKPAPLEIAVLADPIFDRDDARLDALRAHENERPAGDLIARIRGVLGSGRDYSALNLPALPGTEDEARAVLNLVSDPRQRLIALGLDASREKALDPVLGKYRIIDFATHALVDTDRPERSGLVLSMVDSDGRPHYGVVTLRDIYNMKLSADLVVLSACNTALGKDIRGEGMVGLTRGFMYAGASRVVSSLWKVDDTAAAQLMSSFYNKILKKNESPASALKEAQMEMWAHSPWKSPRYWGAFVLEGEWR